MRVVRWSEEIWRCCESDCGCEFNRAEAEHEHTEGGPILHCPECSSGFTEWCGRGIPELGEGSNGRKSVRISLSPEFAAQLYPEFGCCVARLGKGSVAWGKDLDGFIGELTSGDPAAGQA